MTNPTQQIFEAKVAGKIVTPREVSSFDGGDASASSGWHAAFLPDGSDETVAEMAEGSDERESSLPRGAAIRALEVRRGGRVGGRKPVCVSLLCYKEISLPV